MTDGPTTGTTQHDTDDTENPGTVRAWLLVFVAVFLYAFWDRWVIDRWGSTERNGLYVYAVYAVFCVATLLMPVIYEARQRGRKRVAKVLRIFSITAGVVGLVAVVLAPAVGLAHAPVSVPYTETPQELVSAMSRNLI